MAKRIRTTAVFFDGEKHYRGDMCWCGAEYDEATNFFIHPLKFEKEKNISTEDKEFRA